MGYKYVLDAEGVKEAHDYLKNQKYLAIDTETTGLDPFHDRVHCLQIGDRNKQYIFDFVRTKPHITPILDLMRSPDIIWVGQNLKFDYKVIKMAYGISLIRMVDCMLAEQILQNGRKGYSAALDTIADKYINATLNKDIRGSFSDHSYGTLFNQVQIEYAAKDVEVPIPIIGEQYKRLKYHRLVDVFHLECQAIKPTAEMELNGIFLDAERWSENYKDAEKLAQEAKEELDEVVKEYVPTDLFGMPMINYDSPVQLVPLFTKITGEAIPNTKAETLEALADRHDSVKALLQYRRMTKRHSTYGPDFLNNIHRATGRVHSNYKQCRSEQGRYASSGPNMQNIPALPIYRRCFRPEDTEKTVMYTADYSGCELRILAELSGDKKFRQIFIDGLDPHKSVASILTDTKYEDIVKAQRKIYKSINFGVTYGMGPKRLSGGLGIDLETAKQLINSYYVAFPGIRTLLDKLAREVKENRYAISTLDGRKRDLTNLDWDNPKHVGHAANIAKNMPFQGGNAAMIKRAMIMLEELKAEYGRPDLKLVACVHDEFVVEGDKDKEEEGKKIVEEAMVKAGEYYVKSVPIVVDVDVGDHWIKS